MRPRGALCSRYILFQGIPCLAARHQTEVGPLQAPSVVAWSRSTRYICEVDDDRRERTSCKRHCAHNRRMIMTSMHNKQTTNTWTDARMTNNTCILQPPAEKSGGFQGPSRTDAPGNSLHNNEPDSRSLGFLQKTGWQRS